jgi:hypothetical protein
MAPSQAPLGLTADPLQLGLTGGAAFLYGALGAFGSLLVVHVLPWARSLMHGTELHLTFTRVLGAILVFVAQPAVGGAVAFAIGGATAPRHAVAYGFGWQGLVGGLLQGSRAADYLQRSGSAPEATEGQG